MAIETIAVGTEPTLLTEATDFIFQNRFNYQIFIALTEDLTQPDKSDYIFFLNPGQGMDEEDMPMNVWAWTQSGEITMKIWER